MNIYPNSMATVKKTCKGNLVDIIMRTKDRPILLVRALSSILDQTYQNWHLYLINDGGDKEKFTEIVSTYKNAFDSKLTVLDNDQHLGKESVLNCALKQSKGDFIAIHDDDDAWHPNFLTRTTEFLKNPKNDAFIGVIVKPIKIWESVVINNEIIEASREPAFPFKTEVTYADILEENFIPNISFLIRKDAISQAGYLNEDLPFLADWDYNLRLLQIGDIGVISEELAYKHYRIYHKMHFAYNNAIQETDQFTIHNSSYRNALIRHNLNENPHLIGLFTLMTSHKNKIFHELLSVHYKLDTLLYKVDQIEQKQNKGSFFKKIKRKIKVLKEKWKRK